MNTPMLAALCVVVGSTIAADAASDFSVQAPLNREGPGLTVRVVEQPATSNWHYDLHVTTTDGLDQHFAIRNGRPLTPKDVRLADLTGEGFLDIMIVGGTDHRGQEWFKTWLYDARDKKYRWINDR